MVPVKCVLLNTLDRYTKEKWPTEMAVRPLKGDMVKSKSGKRWLKVANVCHVIIKIPIKDFRGFEFEDVMGLEVYLSR